MQYLVANNSRDVRTQRYDVGEEMGAKKRSSSRPSSRSTRDGSRLSSPPSSHSLSHDKVHARRGERSRIVISTKLPTYLPSPQLSRRRVPPIILRARPPRCASAPVVPCSRARAHPSFGGVAQRSPAAILAPRLPIVDARHVRDVCYPRERVEEAAHAQLSAQDSR